MENATAQFLGKDYQWYATEILLEDIQALHGGITLKIRGNGSSVATVLEPGKGDRRYRFSLDRSASSSLKEILIAQDFLTIKPEERAGIPDEARPTITLTNSRRESHKISKWAGVQDIRFEEVYRAIRELCPPPETWVYLPAPDPPWLAIAKIMPYILLALGTPFVTRKLAIFLQNVINSQDPSVFILPILGLIGILFICLGINLLCEWLTIRHTDPFSRPVSIVIVVLCLLAFANLLFMPPLLLKTSLSRWGTPTTAEITEKFTHLDYDTESNILHTDYYLKYEYQMPSGKAFYGKQLVKASAYNTINPGDRLTVYYWSKFPRWSGLEAVEVALSQIPFFFTTLLTLITWSLELSLITYLFYPLWQTLKPKPQPPALPRHPR